MSKSLIDITNTTFGKTSAEADCLTISLFDNEFTFCETTHDTNTILFVTSLLNLYNQTRTNFLSEALKETLVGGNNFNFVYINYFSKYFTLCPAMFFNSQSARTLLEFNTRENSGDIILTDDVTQDIKLIYSIEEGTKSALDKIFPNHRIKHNLTVLCQLMLQHEELLQCDLLVNINSNYIETVIQKNHKLEFANQFQVKTQEDVLYFILFVIEQFQLDPQLAQISLAGNITANSELVTILKKYIKNIKLVKGNKILNFDRVNGMPQHFNYTLINRMFCE